MYTFIYVDPQKFQWITISCFKNKLRTTRKCQLQDQSQTFGLDLVTYVQNIELDQNFDDTEFLEKSDHTSNDKFRLFCGNIVLIKEEWFDDININGGATFPRALIKHVKYICNQKINFLRDTKRRIQEIAINNGCNT